MLAYFQEYVPKWLIPEIEKVASKISSYFPTDYAAEMAAIAPVLGLKLGDIVYVTTLSGSTFKSPFFFFKVLIHQYSSHW